MSAGARRLSATTVFMHHRRMRQPLLRAAPFALAALTCAAFGPRPAHADDNSAAVESLFSEGRSLMAAGKVAEACPKFLASYTLEHRVGTLLSLADCYEQNRQIASAWARFIEARTLATRNNQPERADYAAKHAAMLEPRRSMLTVNADASIPGLVVQRDGQVVDPGIFGVAVAVDGGTHTMSVSATGKKPVSESITIAPEAERKTYALPPLVDAPTASGAAVVAGTSAPGASSSSTASRGLGTQKILAIVSGSVGLVGLGLGAAFGGIALSDKSSAQAACPGTLCQTPDGVSKWSGAATSANVATAGFVIGGVGLVGAALLWFTAPKGSGPAAQVGIGPGSLQIKGSW